LVNLGIGQDRATSFTKRQASAVINKLKQERCTVKQAAILHDHGYKPEDFNVDSAHQLIYQIAANGWKRCS
jgi:hypothetical protein